MNIAIDFGNTRIKAGCFVNNKLDKDFIFNTVDELLNKLKALKPQKIIIGSVINIGDDVLNRISAIAPTLIFKHSTPIPIKNKYKSINTLGSDRLAAAIGANTIFPNHNLLVIDAGTCIKYNFVNSKNEYLGGGISPGLQMRFKAMSHFTARLPLVAYDKNFNSLIGTNSIDSIKMGAQLGFIAEVKEIAAQYLEKYTDINIVLTGGDAPLLQKALKNNIFADPFLILKGLNSVLNYQEEKK